MLRLRMGRKAEADADLARSLALKPEMKTSLEERIKVLQKECEQFECYIGGGM